MSPVSQVSIRALRAGRMAKRMDEEQVPFLVSIRALRAGRMNSDSGDRADFPGFQSAPCVQGECGVLLMLRGTGMFQSAPCVQGECCPRRCLLPPNSCFNPRPACRANGKGSLPGCRSNDVSIRALRAGRMGSMVFGFRSRRSFNPRPACRANAVTLKQVFESAYVSIRALRAGRMDWYGRSDGARWSFNPRPACRANAAGGRS